MKRIFCLIIILLSTCILHSGFPANSTAKQHEGPDTLKKYWHSMTESGNYEEVFESASAAYHASLAKKDYPSALYAALMAGQSMYAANNPDSMYLYLNSAQNLAESNKDKLSEKDYAHAIGVIYNTLGLYFIDQHMNFHKSLRYFTKGLQVTAGKTPSYYAIEGNLAMLYYMRSDSRGLAYSEDVLDYGIRNDNDYYIFIGSYTTAYFHHLSGNDVKSLELIKTAVELVDSFYDKAGVYTLYGDILYNSGEKGEAARYLDSAFVYIDERNACSFTETYLNYADYLCGEKEYSEAASILKQAIDTDFPAKNNLLYKYKLYLKLSDVYHAMDDDTKAMQYYKDYHRQYDSIFKLEREYSINELMVQYQMEKNKRIIYENDIKITNFQKRLAVYGVVIVIALCIIITTVLLYIRKSNMYKHIAKSYYDNECRNTRDKKQIKENTHDNMSTLFKEMERLITEESLYKDKSLTLEELSSRLNTNRTYLSEAVNKITGKNLRTYINTLRIKEATRILSSQGDDTPLKVISDDLGFNDISTFYRSFQKIVGMPPSRFRQEMRNLSASRQ